ncbi:MAG: peptidoglycan D,D-transpeptidase FtsI family protein [Reyranellaceae bacterium]
MISRLFRRKQTGATKLAPLIRNHRIGVNVAGDTIEVARNRLTLGAGVFALAFAVIGLRLVDLSLLRDGAEPRLALAAAGGALAMERAEILDRNGIVLATSIPTASLYANPHLVQEPAEAARKLAKVLPGSSEAELLARLKADRSFVWLKRNLAPREQQLVNALGIPGLDFQREERRIYPQGDLVAHVVGYAGVDNIGLAGVEQFFDGKLRAGDPVTLSIDVRLQRALRQELHATMRKFSAIGAAGIVMDARTGEILSLVSLPGFDPNTPKTIDEVSLFNRATLGVYEMGSTFKIFNTAMALDSGRVTMGSSFDATAPIKIGGFTINDDHAQNRWLTVPELFKHSSNIASAKMAVQVGIETQQAFFDKMGFLKPVKLELPESAAPLYPQTWRPINAMTIAFGHGMAVTPVHLAMGVAGVANNGVMQKPTLLRRPEGAPVAGKRIIEPATARHMRYLMRLVVEEGTGKKADVPGYQPGGKTGTSEKVGAHGGYRKKALLSTFAGAFPMSDPRYVVIVSIDEPKGIKETFGFATAGWVAAPAFAAMVNRIAALYGIMPLEEPVPPKAKPGAATPGAAAPAAPQTTSLPGGRTLAAN